MEICDGKHPICPGGFLVSHPQVHNRDITNSEVGQAILRISEIQDKAEADRTPNENKILEEYKYLGYDITACKIVNGRVIVNHRQPRFELTDPVAKRQLTWLHVIDLLIGMKDRHPFNYFVETDRTTGDVIRIRGIDNENCFQSDFDLPEEGAALQLGTLEVIDKEMQRKILSLSFDDYEILFGGILKMEEIDAAKSRLTALQEKITSGELKIIENDQWDSTELRNPEASYSARDGNPHRLPI